MDSIPLNCLGIYSSHIGDSAEQVQMCDRLERSNVLNRAWETCCVHVKALCMWSASRDKITKIHVSVGASKVS